MSPCSNVLKIVATVSVIALAPAVRAEVPLPPFYAAVTGMAADGRLGTIIKQEKVATPIPKADAWRIAYISSDMAGRKTISTGLIVAPRGAAPAEGRPVLSWAHGTTGTAQSCGPSQVVDPAVPLNEYFLESGNSWTDYGIPALSEFIGAGYVVVATDYQGLGGGGRHQYQLSATQARDAINAIRAAGSLKEAGAGKKAIIYGWSQGAGAAITAASSTEYLDQTGTAFDGIELVGVIAMAPPDFRTMAPPGELTEASAEAMLAGTAKSFSNSVNNFNHFAMTLWAAQAAYPGKLKLTDVFTDEGARFVDALMTNKCVHGASDSLAYAYGDQFATLLKPDVGGAKDWASVLVESAGPNVKPVAPIIIFWGTKDTVVPPIMHKVYRETMCKLGGNVARVQLAGGKTHFATPGASQPLYLPWVADRLAGKPAPDGCAAEQIQD